MKMVAQQYGPQVRSDVISDAVKASFADAMREQNLRIAGLSRASSPRPTPRRADQLEFSAVFEVYPDVRLGDLSDVTDRAAADARSGAEDVERHDRDAAPAAHALRTGVARVPRTGDRVIVDFSGTDRRRRVSRRAGERLRDRPRRRPDAAGVRDRGHRDERRRDQDVLAHVSRPIITARRSPGKRARVHADGEERRGGACCRRSTPSSRKAFGIASGSVDELKAEIAANLQARAEAQDRRDGSRSRCSRRCGSTRRSRCRSRWSRSRRRTWRSGWRPTCASRA